MKSYVQWASESQGNDDYPGLDEFKSGYISPNIKTLYTACWQNDCAKAGAFSGFLTNPKTVEECLDSSGSLDMNKLASKLQLEPSRYDPKTGGIKPAGEPLMVQGYVNAYDIDLSRLEQLGRGSEEEQKLYRKIVDPEGLTPGVSLIKTAFGQTKENYLYEYEKVGPGDQFVIDPKSFNEAAAAGVFKFNNKKSSSVDGSTGKKLFRKEIPYSDYEESLKKIRRVRITTASKQNYLNEQKKKREKELPKPYKEHDKNKYNYSTMKSTDSALATNEHQYRHELHKRGKRYTKKRAAEFARYDLTGTVSDKCPKIVKEVLGIQTEQKRSTEIRSGIFHVDKYKTDGATDLPAPDDPKPYLLNHDKVVISIDSFESLKKDALEASELSKSIMTAQRKISEAEIKAKGIVTRANNKASGVEEEITRPQLLQFQEDFPHLFTNGVYQGKEIPDNKTTPESQNKQDIEKSGNGTAGNKDELTLSDELNSSLSKMAESYRPAEQIKDIEVKKDFWHKDKVIISGEDFKALKREAEVGAVLSKHKSEIQKYVESAGAKAESIVAIASGKAARIIEMTATSQLLKVKKDFPQLFKDDNYKGKDYVDRKRNNTLNKGLDFEKV